jgi:protein O-GlcNAc transferase
LTQTDLLLEQAIAQHRQGRFEPALELYGRVLVQRPDDAAVLHLAGVAQFQRGEAEQAAALIGEAVALRPDLPEPHSNLGAALLALGRVEAAEAAQRRSLALRPDFAQAHHNLGAALQRQGRTEEAIAALRRALDLQPDYPEAWRNLGHALRDRGAHEDAAAAYGRAVGQAPGDAEAQNGLGLMLQALGRFEAAEAAFRQAAADSGSAESRFHLGQLYREWGRPADAIDALCAAVAIDSAFPPAQGTLAALLSAEGRTEEAAAVLAAAVEACPDQLSLHLALGMALRRLGRQPEAVTVLRRAVFLDPNTVEAYELLGGCLLDTGLPDPAAGAFRAALACRSDIPEQYNNLGTALNEAGRLGEARVALEQAIALAPDLDCAWSNLSIVLRDLQLLPEAEVAAGRAIQLAPKAAGGHVNLANVRHSRYDYDRALDSFRTASALRPDLLQAHNGEGNVLKDMGLVAEAAAAYRTALTTVPEPCPRAMQVHSNLLLTLNNLPFDPADLLAEHRAWAAIYAVPRADLPPLAPSAPASARRLRLGYVSPDFRQHVVSHFTEPVFAAHDRTRFEIFCYSQSSTADEVTLRLAAHGDTWVHTAGMADDVLARRIRDDRIDILIDLAGHTAGNRLSVFANRPAPVQVTWLGYPNTTGMPQMDYRLTDPVADPPGPVDAGYTEELIRLPGPFLCFRPIADAPEPAPPPCLTAGHVTFGSFNNLAKITDAVIALWARVLQAVPRSRLFMKAQGLTAPTTRARIRARFAEAGIGDDRLELQGWLPGPEHNAAFARIDALFDPFPYNGTTTTCEALWMGVPVITLAGDRHAARVGASLLTAIGRPDLIARDADDYVRIAAGLAADPAGLAAARAGQRAQMRGSALCDEAGFTHGLEQALSRLWHRRVAADPPVITASDPSEERARLQAAVAARPGWRHAIALPYGVKTPGPEPVAPVACDLPDRLDGLRVLDIDTGDGYWAFEALKRGAREVMAIDTDPDARSRFDLCRAALGFSEDRCRWLELAAGALDPDRHGRFDLILCLNGLHRQRHPLMALERAATVSDGMILVESVLLDTASPAAVAEFRPESGGWLPTLHALGAWVEAAGFTEVEGWLLADRPAHPLYARGYIRGHRTAARPTDAR